MEPKKYLKNGTTTVTIIHYSLFIEPIKCILTRCSYMGEMLNVNRPWPVQIVHPAFGPWLLLWNINGKLFCCKSFNIWIGGGEVLRTRFCKKHSFPNNIKGWGNFVPVETNGKFCLGIFFIGWWEPEEEWFWPFKPFLKLKTTFCKYWRLIKIKISKTCVYKVYEVKIKMAQEQWLKLKRKFLLGYNIKVAIQWGVGINLWWGSLL